MQYRSWRTLFSLFELFLAVTGVFFLLDRTLSPLLGSIHAFDSDEFLHAAPAHDLAVYLSEGNIAQYLLRLGREVFYPPLHPSFSRYFSLSLVQVLLSQDFSLLFVLLVPLSCFSLLFTDTSRNVVLAFLSPLSMPGLSLSSSQLQPRS
jgi:hypothetical protein